jgi:hypothetical protein
MFENVKKVEKLLLPTIVFHGSADELIPLKHSKVRTEENRTEEETTRKKKKKKRCLTFLFLHFRIIEIGETFTKCCEICDC